MRQEMIGPIEAFAAESLTLVCGPNAAMTMMEHADENIRTNQRVNNLV